MRWIRSVRVRTPPQSRDEYLSLLEEMATLCRESPDVKGFYLMESAERPGDFWEFYEFEDESAAVRQAERAATEPRFRDLVKRLRQIVPDELTDTSFWQQRL